MVDTSAIKLLTDRNLRVTLQRVAILKELLQESGAVSQPILERALSDVSDRATIYRNLKTLTEAGLLHKITNADGAALYALCQGCRDTKVEHSHNHAHFTCRQCNKTECLETARIHIPVIPAGYQLEDASLMLEGICSQCNKTS